MLRVQHWVPLAPEAIVEHPSPVRYALAKPSRRRSTSRASSLVGIVRIVQGRLSLKSLSGPITIYEVAGEEGRKGADYFVWVMAAHQHQPRALEPPADSRCSTAGT